jgi:hypothetical protein
MGRHPPRHAIRQQCAYGLKPRREIPASTEPGSRDGSCAGPGQRGGMTWIDSLTCQHEKEKREFWVGQGKDGGSQGGLPPCLHLPPHRRLEDIRFPIRRRRECSIGARRVIPQRLAASCCSRPAVVGARHGAWARCPRRSQPLRVGKAVGRAVGSGNGWMAMLRLTAANSAAGQEAQPFRAIAMPILSPTPVALGLSLTRPPHHQIEARRGINLPAVNAPRASWLLSFVRRASRCSRGTDRPAPRSVEIKYVKAREFQSCLVLCAG